MQADVFVVVIQLVLSISLGILAFRVLTKIARLRRRPEVAKATQDLQCWPAPFPRLTGVVSLLLPALTRLARPSARIRRELLVTAHPIGFDDLEFSRMQGVLGFFGVVSGVGGLCLIVLVKGFVPSLGFWAMPLLFGALGFYFPRARLREKSGAVLKRIQRSFPSFLDVFALTLESGQNFQSALILAGQHLAEPSGRPGLRAQLEEVLRVIRAGKPRVDALQQMAERLGLPEVIQFVASVATSEKQGASITGLLRRQSQQLRLSRALAAERHAMKLPVKLLAPLAICIFPCTFLVLGFPIGIQLLSSGIFSS